MFSEEGDAFDMFVRPQAFTKGATLNANINSASTKLHRVSF